MITDLLNFSTNKAYLSAITLTNISQPFTHTMAAKSSGIDIWNDYDVTVALCISTGEAR